MSVDREVHATAGQEAGATLIRRSHDSAAPVRNCIGTYDSDHALLGLMGQHAQDSQGLAL